MQVRNVDGKVVIGVIFVVNEMQVVLIDDVQREMVKPGVELLCQMGMQGA